MTPETTAPTKATPQLYRYIRPVLAFVMSVGTLLFMYTLIYKEIPERNIATLQIVIGFIMGTLSTIMAYYFGSSKDKSDAEQFTRQPNTTTTQQTTVEDAKAPQP